MSASEPRAAHANADHRPQRWIPVLAILVVSLALALIWGRTALEGGVRISPDSALFMSLAHDLAWGGSERIPTNRAPGYIWLLAATLRFEPFPDTAAAWLSAVQLFITLALLGVLLYRLIDSTLVALLGIVCLAALPGYLAYHVSALTEPTFAMFLIGHVAFVHRYLVRPGTGCFIGAAACASGAALTRYVGDFAFVSLALLMLFDWFRSCMHWRRRAAQVVILLLAAAPSAAWMLRNYALDGTLHGKRRPAVVSVQENIVESAGTLRADLGMYLPLIALGAGLAAVVRGRFERRATAAYVLLLLACYLALLIYGLSTADVDRVNSRYFAPIYPLGLLLAFSGYGLAGDLAGSRGWNVLRWMLRAVVPGAAGWALLMTAPAARDLLANFNRGQQVMRHLDAGFANSPTAVGMRAWTAARLDELDELHVAVLSDPARPHRGRVLFMRRGLLPEYQELRGAAGPHFDYRWLMLRDGRRQVLHVHDLPPIQGLEKLEAAVRAAADQAAPRPFFLIIDRSVRTRELLGDEWQKADELLTERRVRPSESIRPYAIYRFEGNGPVTP